MNSSTEIDLVPNKPLLIYGGPGSGKTHLALELLKDTILLRIDVSQINEYKDIKNYILDRIKKRNITLMFLDKRESRGILIDDIHIFHRHDKYCFKSLMEFMNEGAYHKSKIVITCNNSFLKNKNLCKLKISRYEIKHTYAEYYKLCLRIVRERLLRIDLKSCDLKIYESNYNLNTFLSECCEDSRLMKDNFDGIEQVTRNILQSEFKMDEIFHMVGTDNKIILLNLLENIESNFVEIFAFADYFNRVDIFIHNPEILNIPIKMINRFRHMTDEIIYNRYISKNMIKHKYMKNDILSERYIYLLDTYNRDSRDTRYKDELLKIDDKIIKHHISAYEKLYNIKWSCRLN